MCGQVNSRTLAIETILRRLQVSALNIYYTDSVIGRTRATLVRTLATLLLQCGARLHSH